jgi:hypothetical protein
LTRWAAATFTKNSENNREFFGLGAVLAISAIDLRSNSTALHENSLCDRTANLIRRNREFNPAEQRIRPVGTRKHETGSPPGIRSRKAPCRPLPELIFNQQLGGLRRL